MENEREHQTKNNRTHNDATIQKVQALETTPHTLRILRLIASNSSPACTQQAISVLSQVASRSHPVVLWDILARLYTSLTIPDECDASVACVTRRKNISLAMEHVAKHIPIGDQRNFLRESACNVNGNLVQRSGEDDGDENEYRTPRLKSMIGKTENDVNPCLQNNTNQRRNREHDCKEWISVGDLCEQSFLDLVLTKGRLLLSCSETYYDTKGKCNSHMNDYEIENEMLSRCDTGAQPSSAFLRERVSLQRSILARRLGFGGILASSMVQNYHDGTINDMVHDSDLLTIPTCSEQVAKKSARDRNIRRMRKRKKIESSSSSLHNRAKNMKQHTSKKLYGDGQQNNNNTNADKASDTSIRKLLLLSIEQSSQEQNQRQSFNILLSHRHPQTLLATDLIYQTFHPSWHVRHGCLLGLLALLNSWRSRINVIEANASNDSQPRREKEFGTWPHDILARTLCVLALDRFGDYSGQLIRSSDKQGSSALEVSVAPVRETAAQVVSLLFDMAPPATQHSTLRVLQLLSQHKAAWEVRHGAILVYKYISEFNRKALAHHWRDCTKIQHDSSPEPDYSMNPSSWIIISSTIASGLGDPNDDVRGASAQTISSLLAHSRCSMNNFDFNGDNFEHQMVHAICTRCIEPLWTALSDIKSTSSCSQDLLCCLCDLIKHDCALVLKSIGLAQSQLGPGQCTTFTPIEDLFGKLCEFLNFELISMRITCVQTISLIVTPLTESVLSLRPLDCHVEGTDVTAYRTSVEEMLLLFCTLMRNIFESFFTDAEFTGDKSDQDGVVPKGTRCRENCETDYLAEFITMRSTAWEALIAGADSLLCHKNLTTAPFHNMALDLLLRFFKMASPRHSASNPQGWKFNITSKMSKYYRCLQSAAKAYAALYNKRGTSIKGAELHISIAIHAHLRSPWPELCESACILLDALGSEEGFQFQAVFDTCHPTLLGLMERNPPCLSINVFENINEIKDDKLVQHLCAGAMETVLRQLNPDALHSKIQSAFEENSATLLQIWSDIFKKYGIDLYNEPVAMSALSTITSMRLSAAVASAIVSLRQRRLPSRLTHLIRALVTSMKNERNAARSCTVNASIVKLLQVLQISRSDSHSKVYNKLLSNISDMASEHNCSKIGFERSKMIIQSFIAQLPAEITLKEINPIWGRVKYLSSFDPAVHCKEKLMKAMVLFNSISMSFKRGSKCLEHATSVFLSTTIVLACTSPIALLRHVAVNVVSKICEVGTDLAMPIALSLIFKYLRLNDDDPSRLGASRLLNNIVCSTGVSLCGYVKFLVPVVMSMMIDPLKPCADLSASTFSRVVRLAPLVDANQHIELDLDGSNQECSEKVIEHLIHGKPLPPCEIPEIIRDAIHKNNITLRKYQVEGISWIQFLKSVKLNGALCDDMGLGKTLQALIGISIAHEASAGNDIKLRPKSLVVCPSSVIGEWVNEVNKLGLQSENIIRVLLYTGSKRKERWIKDFESCNLVITSYPILRSDIDKLKKLEWTYCVLDEGHLLKNPKSLTAKAARVIRSDHKLILTGTPVQNKVHEVWATFDWLMPNYLGSDTDFSAEYANVISRGNLPGANPTDIMKSQNKLKQLHQQVLPFILRREKNQVLKELPPKTITDIPCVMTESQRNFYNEISSTNAVQKAFEVIGKVVTENIQTDTRKKSNQSIDNVDNDTLKSFLPLRLICTHPCLVTSRVQVKHIDGDIYQDNSVRYDASGKFIALNDLLRRAQFYEEETTAADNDDSLMCLDGPNGRLISDEVINEFDDEIIEQSFGMTEVSPISKCLIFAQYTQSLDAIEKILFKPHMPSLRYVRLDGRTKQKDRVSIVEAFQFDDNVRCMLLTSKVGSLGLNLQAADTVIFLENDWNPFVDLQAMDRSHRLGQRMHVKVYRLVTSNSIEEKIMAIQRIKIAMSGALVNTENSAMFSMGTDRLLDLFTSADKQSCDDVEKDHGISFRTKSF